MENINFYEGCEYSLDECREFLSLFGGGKVDVILEESGIAKLCLNHPETRNSITGNMMVELETAVAKLESWPLGKAVVIYGADSNFCSGGDLNFAKQSGNPEGGYKMANFMHRVLSRLQNLPMITVAYIEGSALGGGAELAIACDFRIFHQDSALGFVHSKMGIIPAWGGLTNAVQTLGYRTALDLVTTGRVVQADEAVRLGVCDTIVADMTAALEWVDNRTQSDASVVQAAKKVALNSRLAVCQTQALEFEKRVFTPLWGAPANRLALSKKLKHK